jgi:hypothetical protein
MKKFILIFLLAPMLHAQTTVPAQPAFTVPAPDGSTIVSKAGVWSCTVSGLPASVYNLATGALTVNSVTTSQIILINGTAYPAGKYNVLFDGSGNLTYTPDTDSGGGSAPVGASYTLPVPAQAAWAVTYTSLPNVVIKSGQTFSVTPVFSGVPGLAMNYLNGVPFVNAAGVFYLRVSNGSGTATPATSWTVVVK